MRSPRFIQIKETPGGGSCLFNSVAFGMLYYLGEEANNTKIITMGKRLRKCTVKRLNELVKTNNDLKAVILGEMENYTDLSNAKKVRRYICEMRHSYTWGGEIEARILNSLVKTHGFRGIRIINEETQKNMNYFAGSVLKTTSKDIIHITLSNVANGGCHFSFVIPRSSSV